MGFYIEWDLAQGSYEIFSYMDTKEKYKKLYVMHISSQEENMFNIILSCWRYLFDTGGNLRNFFTRY